MHATMKLCLSALILASAQYAMAQSKVKEVIAWHRTAPLVALLQDDSEVDAGYLGDADETAVKDIVANRRVLVLGPRGELVLEIPISVGPYGNGLHLPGSGGPVELGPMMQAGLKAPGLIIKADREAAFADLKARGFTVPARRTAKTSFVSSSKPFQCETGFPEGTRFLIPLPKASPANGSNIEVRRTGGRWDVYLRKRDGKPVGPLQAIDLPFEAPYPCADGETRALGYSFAPGLCAVLLQDWNYGAMGMHWSHERMLDLTAVTKALGIEASCAAVPSSYEAAKVSCMPVAYRAKDMAFVERCETTLSSSMRVEVQAYEFYQEASGEPRVLGSGNLPLYWEVKDLAGQVMKPYSLLERGKNWSRLENALKSQGFSVIGPDDAARFAYEEASQTTDASISLRGPAVDDHYERILLSLHAEPGARAASAALRLQRKGASSEQRLDLPAVEQTCETPEAKPTVKYWFPPGGGVFLYAVSCTSAPGLGRNARRAILPAP